RLDAPGAEQRLAALVTRVGTKSSEPGLALDFLEAARSRGTPALRKAVEGVEAGLSAGDPLASFRICLEGGDAGRGSVIFTNHPRAQCVRCHRAAGQGGSAGPDLAGVATRHDRQGLLRSLVDPDAAIAQGFATVQLALRDGRVVAGVLKGEANGEITVETPAGLVTTVRADEVEERSPPRSAMPKMGEVLTRRELRDVVEYLSGLRQPQAGARP
ncbi:MAG: c-type cytochrome, partial [Isosphaeraceae bacterium]